LQLVALTKEPQQAAVDSSSTVMLPDTVAHRLLSAFASRDYLSLELMQSLDDDKLERKWTAITDRCYGTSLPVSYWIFVGIIYHTWVEH